MDGCFFLASDETIGTRRASLQETNSATRLFHHLETPEQPYLLEAIQGDRTALNRLVQLWYRRVYNLNLRYLGEEQAALEATQLTFVSVANGIHKLQDAGSFQHWLYRIALNHCRMAWRSQKRNRLDFPGEWDESSIIDYRQPDYLLQQKERNILIQQALQQLSPEQREIVLLKEWENLTFREIAALLDISENTAKSRLYYALNNLKKIMLPQGSSKSIWYEDGR